MSLYLHPEAAHLKHSESHMRPFSALFALLQVSAVHVLQTLIRGSSGLGTARCQDVTSMVILVLKALGSPCWAMRNAAIQLFGTPYILGGYPFPIVV